MYFNATTDDNNRFSANLLLVLDSILLNYPSQHDNMRPTEAPGVLGPETYPKMSYKLNLRPEGDYFHIISVALFFLAEKKRLRDRFVTGPLRRQLMKTTNQ